MKIKLIFISILVTITELCMAQVCGCTDSLAINYDTNATINDGSCEYEAVMIDITEIGMLDSLLDGSSSLFFWNNGYWTFNDHNDNCLYQIDSTNATTTESLCINGISSDDIEEISQDSLYLYFGDIGNNRGSRRDLHILRISKESILNHTFAVDTIAFYYEDQTDFSPQPQSTDFDCEAFVVSRDSIYLFTKQWVSKQTTLYSFPKTPGTHIAHRHETFNANGLVTGAVYLPEYQLAVLCGYDYATENMLSALHPFIVLLYDFQAEKFFSGNKRRLDFDYLIRAQVEAIATHNGLDYYITSEHFTASVMGFNINSPAKLMRLDLRDYLLSYLSKFDTSDNQNTIQNSHRQADDIHIYPNPATDRLYIQCSQTLPGAEYEIFNLNGQLMMEGVLKDNIIYLNNRNLAAGKYILALRQNEKMKTFSFIKKEE